METINTKDIAKQVRRDLKALCPSVIFKVTSTYNKISVSYMDGIPQEIIQKAVEKYRGYRDLDTYGDYGNDTTHRDVIFEGCTVATNLNYIFVSRNYSERYLKEVYKYVQDCWETTGLEHIRVALNSYDNSAYFDSNTYDDAIQLCQRLSRECSALESVKAQQDRKFEKQRIEFEEYKAKKEVETFPFPDEPLVITPIAITDHTVDPRNLEFVECKFPSGNKRDTIDQYLEQLEETKICRAVIERVVFISQEDYDLLMENLLYSQDWLTGMGGSDSTAPLREVKSFSDYTKEEQQLWRDECYELATLIYAEDRAPILANPEGYDYPRYVGFINPILAERYLPKAIAPATPAPSNLIQFPTNPKTEAIALYSAWVTEMVTDGKAMAIVSFDEWVGANALYVF